MFAGFNPDSRVYRLVLGIARLRGNARRALAWVDSGFIQARSLFYSAGVDDRDNVYPDTPESDAAGSIAGKNDALHAAGVFSDVLLFSGGSGFVLCRELYAFDCATVVYCAPLFESCCLEHFSAAGTVLLRARASSNLTEKCSRLPAWKNAAPQKKTVLNGLRNAFTVQTVVREQAGWIAMIDKAV